MATMKLIAVVITLTTCLLGQGNTSQKTHASTQPAGPTKVSGPPTQLTGGLEYWDIKRGVGREAKTGDTVKMEYTGWLTNGKKFDSNAGSGRPFTVKLGAGEVIKGWDQGIPGMKVGGKRQLRIPPDLAYGAAGYPGAIPPNSTLIFDVSLVGIQ